MIATPPRSGSRLIPFKPQLSGLRFCAVLFVVVYHFSSFLESFKRVYDLGNFIVFFFVLSSYLITKILLKAKGKAAEAGIPRHKVALAFLVRRTFRIFPAYYLYLLILILLPIEGVQVREHASMYFLYLSNVQIFIQKAWGSYTAHLWTLAVEEQFYLIWPWIILFVPGKYLLRVFGGFIVLAVFFRIGFTWYLHAGGFEMWVLTPACADSFALGALLALRHHEGKTENAWIGKLVLLILPIWILLIFTNHQRTFVGVNRLFLSLVSVVIINNANRGIKGLTGKMLESRVVQYLAKISYGIYLYHLVAFSFYWKLFNAADLYFKTRGLPLTGLRRLSNSPWIGFWMYAAIAMGCAMISWYLVEKPVNNLKRYIQYVMPRKKMPLDGRLPNAGTLVPGPDQ